MRFFITDKDQAVCDEVSKIIEDLGNVVVGTVDDVLSVNAKMLVEQRVEVVLGDFFISCTDGMKWIEHVRNNAFEGMMIMTAKINSDKAILKYYSAGIDYFLPKPINKFMMISALQMLEEKREMKLSILHSEKEIKRLEKQIEENKVEIIKRSLTPAEKEILKLKAKGYSRIRIADETYRSEDTVKSHIRGINRKMGTTNYKEAARMAKDFGII
ncbi:MAG TPA: LuxR C-terminal-related transcriptional regulator [Bacillales bacterium]